MTSIPQIQYSNETKKVLYEASQDACKFDWFDFQNGTLGFVTSRSLDFCSSIKQIPQGRSLQNRLSGEGDFTQFIMFTHRQGPILADWPFKTLT